jgi:hypothetical protein
MVPMTGPVLYGDPIDPNEPYLEAPVQYATAVYEPYPPSYAPAGYRADPNARPGEVVVAAVLSLVIAGLLLITGFVVIFAASSLDTPDTADGIEASNRATLFVFAGLTNVVAAALLIIGAVLMLGRSSSGRTTIAAGTLLCMALGIFWLANDQNDGGILVWLIIFCTPVITATILSTSTRVNAWFRSGSPA